MALFGTDSLVLRYSNLEQAKRWWMDAFDCKAVRVPSEWDDPLPSDVALKLPGYDEPTILLSDRTGAEQAHLDRSVAVPVIFSSRLRKAHEHLSRRGITVGQIQGDEAPHFFEIRDIEGNVIEICEET
ncbi:MAG TPA: VOC family protein [Terriglobales bacterium]|nr:VOC family protein [Terriglobales bacterium]